MIKRHGPSSAAELVSKHGVEAAPEALHRALRACAALGIFSEDAMGKFGPTEMSEVLTTDALGSVKKLVQMVGNLLWKVWTGLPDGLRTGEPQAKNQLGMEFFDYLAAHPDQMNEFGEAMESNSFSAIGGLLERYDFTGIRSVVDVGGGLGHLVTALLTKYPNLHGILLERPEMISAAKDRQQAGDPSVNSRLDFVVGDMFESVPDADAYVLKTIMHDWNDAQCVKILQNCCASMTAGGRVICIDAVVPSLGDSSDPMTKLVDVNMMLICPGQERTMAQWEDLYRKSGLKISRMIPVTDNVNTSLVEGVKAF